MGGRFEIIVGRIEQLALDAVVNAANQRLLPGTGVDGALRAAAGPELTAHTKTLQPIDEGGVVITPGFNLPARYVIHTAAPIWPLPGSQNEKIEGLRGCYLNSVALAAEHQLTSIAFPCLGTGNYGWPQEVACGVALDACTRALDDAPIIQRLVFCCFSEGDAAVYRARVR